MQEMEFDLKNRSALDIVSTDWLFSEEADAEKLAFDMIKYMQSNRGIGLAANQIGMTKRVFVMGAENILGFPKPFALFNPRIVAASEEQVLDHEGCLSYPGLTLSIKRPSWVAVEYEDYNGVTRGYKAEGYASKCVQHEIDHLNGICFVDIVSPLKLKLAKKKQRKNSK
jgi:peptide deformylase